LDRSPHISGFVKVNDIRLHYLDWGGSGPVLLFLAGLSNSAHIYDQFAPRFTDKFHVLALTRRGHGESDYPETGYDADTLANDVRQFMDTLHIDQAILAGHSMSNIELCHVAALYPERVLKLVFLDAAYDRTSPAFKAKAEKNPLRNIPIPGLDAEHTTVEAYAEFIKRSFPSLAAIWGELMDEELRYGVTINADGKVVDKMTPAIEQALRDALAHYKPEDSSIQAPALSIFVIDDGNDALSPYYMSEEQKTAVLDYFDTVRPALQREGIEQFRRDVPHARIVEIPKGHHYCFIKQEQIVFDAMRAFLLE
jgi:pimeloyl-ACP methyl ester carboxylesterase